MYQGWNYIYTILLLLFAGALFSDSARCQTESFEALPPLPSLVEHSLQIPAGGSFTSLLPGFEQDTRGEDSGEQDATGSSPRPQIQTQQSDRQGLVMRSVKRTFQDQKELYRAPFKPSNFKWDALVLGGNSGAFGLGPTYRETHWHCTSDGLSGQLRRCDRRTGSGAGWSVPVGH